MKLIYRVTVNYQDFDFTDHITADTFAALAKQNAIKTDDKKTKVDIEYLTEEEAKK